MVCMLFFLAALLLIGAGIAYLISRSAEATLQAVSSAQSVSSATLPADGSLVEMSGTGSLDERQMLRAPESGTSCLWFRSKVTHHWTEYDRSSQHGSSTQHRSQVVQDYSSTQPFWLQDGEGYAAILPEGAEVDQARKAWDQRQERGWEDQRDWGSLGGILGGSISFGSHQHSSYYQVEEWVIQAGTPLYVVGAGTRSGDHPAIGRREKGKFVISTRSESALEEASGKSAQRARLASMICGGLGGVCLLLALLQEVG